MIQSCLLTGSGPSGIFPVEPEQRGGVFLKLLDARVFNAVAVNPDFGCVEWPGGVALCPDTMHQAMTGSESEPELHSAEALREEAKKNHRVPAPEMSFTRPNVPSLIAEIERLLGAEAGCPRPKLLTHPLPAGPNRAAAANVGML